MTARRGGLIGGSLALVLMFGPGTVQWLRLCWHERVLDRRLRELEATHQHLRAEQQRLASDPVSLEGLIRSTFKVSKPGELVVPLSEEPSHARRSLSER